MTTAAIKESIRRDRKRERPNSTQICECFACGRGMVYRVPRGDESGRFCTPACRSFYDLGFAPAVGDPTAIYERHHRVVAGGDPGYMPQLMRIARHGFVIDCAGCQQQFEGRGLRCCSVECERRCRERSDNVTVLAEIGVDAPAKRRCEACGAAI